MQQESDRALVRAIRAVGGGAAVRDEGRRLNRFEPEWTGMSRTKKHSFIPEAMDRD